MDILILGGGISGLSAACRLLSLAPSANLCLLEASSRLGGWIKTSESLVEEGPRTFSTARSPHLLSLIEELGLTSELIASSQTATKRYILHRGRLRSAGSLLLRHAGSLLLEPFRKRGFVEETVHEFAVRRFGLGIAELFFDPLTIGIFGGSSKTLSLQACFPALAEWEQHYGSIVKRMIFAPKSGKQGLFTLRRGMQMLIDALGQKLQRHCRLNEPVVSLARAKDTWRVQTSQKTYEADVVFAALPAPQLAQLLPEMPSIECLSLDLVHLGFSSLKHPFPGYGYLVPSSEQESLMGMIFDSEVFPHQREGAKFTAMVRPGGPSKEIALRALSSHLHIKNPPDWIEISHAKQAIPQYRLGHLERMRAFEQRLPNLYLLGNYIDGPSVDHCIGRSIKMVKHFLEKKILN